MEKRLDKYLCDKNIGTRTQVKALITKGLVQVNSEVIKQPNHKITDLDQVLCQGRILSNEEYAYYILHKPAGIITAVKDEKQPTVLDYFKKEPCRGLYPVGRLDKDTEGLLLITNDGELGHRLLSPRHHIEKTYYARIARELTQEQICILQNGVDIGEKRKTLPAMVKCISPTEIEITITEGKYHQIKRMLAAVENQVLYLKRISMGALTLPKDLPPGSFRRLTKEEITYLKCLSKEDGKEIQL